MERVVFAVGRLFAWLFVVPTIYYCLSLVVSLVSGRLLTELPATFDNLDRAMFFAGIMLGFATLRETPPPDHVLYTFGFFGMILTVLGVSCFVLGYPFWQGCLMLSLACLGAARAACH